MLRFEDVYQRKDILEELRQVVPWPASICELTEDKTDFRILARTTAAESLLKLKYLSYLLLTVTFTVAVTVTVTVTATVVTALREALLARCVLLF